MLEITSNHKNLIMFEHNSHLSIDMENQFSSKDLNTYMSRTF